MSEHRLCKRCGITREIWDMYKVEGVWVCYLCYQRWLDRQGIDLTRR